MKTVAINFTDIKLVDLEGVEYKIENFANKLANRIFTRASTIPLSDKARELFKGEPVELNVDEMQEVYLIMDAKPNEYKPWIHSQLMPYLDNKLKEFNNLKTEENA